MEELSAAAIEKVVEPIEAVPLTGLVGVTGTTVMSTDPAEGSASGVPRNDAVYECGPGAGRSSTKRA